MMRGAGVGVDRNRADARHSEGWLARITNRRVVGGEEDGRLRPMRYEEET